MARELNEYIKRDILLWINNPNINYEEIKKKHHMSYHTFLKFVTEVRKEKEFYHFKQE